MSGEPSDWRRELAAVTTGTEAAPLEIARHCVQRLSLSGAGASLASSDSRAVLFATDERAERIEDLQFTLGVGPCIDAIDHGSAVLVPDVRNEFDGNLERWPGFLDAADAAGVRAVFALPLRIGAIGVGALDLHRTEPGPLSSADLRRAFVAADLIASVLVGDGVDGSAEGHSGWAGPAYGMHVHQATGMVQAQLDIPTAQALLALRARAYAEGRTVSELARDVVERRVRFQHGDDT